MAMILKTKIPFPSEAQGYLGYIIFILHVLRTTVKSIQRGNNTDKSKQILKYGLDKHILKYVSCPKEGQEKDIKNEKKKRKKINTKQKTKNKMENLSPNTQIII